MKKGRKFFASFFLKKKFLAFFRLHKRRAEREKAV